MSGHHENLDVLCRLCLCDDGKVPIFSNSDLSNRIFQCVAIQVEKDEKLPLNVCSGCISCIDSWYRFKEKCHKSQDKLLAMVEQPTPRDKSEEDAVCNGAGRAEEELADLGEAEELDGEVLNGDDGPEKAVSAGEDDASQAPTEYSGMEDGSRSAAASPTEKGRLGINCSSKNHDTETPTAPSGTSADANGKKTHEIDGDEDTMYDDEYEDFEEDLDEFDEPETAQLINPKFAAKLKHVEEEAADKLDTAAEQLNVMRADSTGASSRPITVNLCEEEEEDDEVSVIEPVIEKINLDPPEPITSTVGQDSAGTGIGTTGKHTVPKDGTSLRIESAVTLPAPGDFHREAAPHESASAPGEAEGTEHVLSAETSRDNSPERMSGVEDDQFEDEGISQDGASAPRSVADPNRTTPDSTMISTNQEDNSESQLSMDILIKEETMRGYADEEEASMASYESGSSSLPGDKTRDEYLREMLLSDPTVDVNKDKCIICDHVFYTVSSLLRHTKCRMHLDTRAIWEMQQKGQEVDPVLLAMHQRKLDSYRLTWNISRKRVMPAPESQPRPPGAKKFTCKPCKVSANSYRDWDRHKNSKKHKLIMMLGEMPSEEKLSEKKTPRKIVRPQPLQYDHTEPPQFLPKPIRPKGPLPGQANREYICPIPNCGYICYEGSLLLTHMTSHGIQGNAPVQQMQNHLKASPKPMQSAPLQSSTPLQPKPGFPNQRPVGSSFPQHPRSYGKPAHTQKYENLFCKYHNIFFETARGYLNHIRHCAMAPPISTFLKPEYKGTAPDKRYCKLCDLSFSTPDMLIQHMSVYHKGSSVQQEMARPAVPVYVPKAMPAKTGVKHKCHLCGKVFNLLHSLNFHLRSHRQQVSSSTPGNTTCKVCKKTFLTRKSCATHLKTHFLHPGSNKMFCSLCYKTFDTRSEIARHRYDGTCHTPIPATGPFDCDLCDFQCKEATALSDHKLKFHTNIKQEKLEDEEQQADVEPVDGEQDDEELTTKIEEEQEQQLQQNEHQKQQSGEESSATAEVENVEEYCKCLLCGKTFYSYANVKRHCRFIHRMPDSKVDNMVKMLNRPPSKGPSRPAGPPPLTPLRKPPPVTRTCGRCGENYNNKALFEEHLLSCNEVAHETPCEQCGSMCGPEGCANCSQDTPKEDRGGLLFKCPIGHMSFSNENAMLKHYSYCTGNCGPYFQCGNCGLEFRFRKNFDAHNCGLSKKKTTYDCSECRRSFSKKIYLINHEMKCPGVSAAGGVTEGSPGTSFGSNSAKKTRQSGPVDDASEEQDPSADTETPPPQVFSCGSCERIFHSSKALCGHMRSHKQAPAQDPMFCKFCGRENLTLTSLYGHLYKCAKSLFMTEEVLTCEDCSTFLSRYDTPKELSAKLHHHVLNCYPIPWYQNQGDTEGSEKLLCYICCHAFSSVEALTIHKSQHNRIKNKRGSPFLKSSAKKRPRLNYSRSMKTEFDPNDMIEEEILESCDSPPSSNTASATQFILNCQVCNRQFNDIDKLQNHEKVHGIVRQVVSETEAIEHEEQPEDSHPQS